MAEPILVRRRGFHQVDELIAEFDKGVARPFAAEREVEDLAVEVESLIDVADLKGEVIDTDKPGFLRASISKTLHDLQSNPAASVCLRNGHGLVPCRRYTTMEPMWEPERQEKPV